MKSRIPLEDRFMRMVSVDANGCWAWTGARVHDGYALFKVDNKMRRAARWAYEHFVGFLDNTLTIDHLCRNRACVNPKHLDAVTIRENLMRGYTAAARNAAKTHCLRGHEFTKDNTYIANGNRKCIACKKKHDRTRYLERSKDESWMKMRREYTKAWQARRRLEKI